jgi:hypothetical protein
MNEQIKEFTKKSVEQIAKELTSVQPMPNTLFSDLYKAGKSTKELKAEGYVPVSNLGLMWIKKDEE